MNDFNLENQYQLYLQRMALSEDTMHPTQKKQLRQTFFGAVGQIIILFRDELSKLDEDVAIATMEDMQNQVLQFFLTENDRHN